MAESNLNGARDTQVGILGQCWQQQSWRWAVEWAPLSFWTKEN
jgi:hypothetical protein